MISLQQAYEILRLSSTPNTDVAAVEQAYRKLLVRYPAELFPERCEKIGLARARLLQELNPVEAFQRGDYFQFDWLLSKLELPLKQEGKATLGDQVLLKALQAMGQHLQTLEDPASRVW